MSRTTYWILLVVSLAAATAVWSGPDRWRAVAEHPHIAAILDQLKLARAEAQTPQATAHGYHPGGPAPVYRTQNSPAQPQYQQVHRAAPTQATPPQQVQPHAPIQNRLPNAPPQLSAIESAQVLAIVGDQVILAEEVIGPINQTLAPYANKMPLEQMEKTRRGLIEKSIKQLIPTKLLYGEYLSNVPPENQQQVTKSIAETFAEKRLPEMMKKANVSTRLDLDAKFRAFGTSLERQRQQFIENSIASQWIQMSVTYDKDVTYDQMVDYYRVNLADYEVQAKVRWQQISIRFSKSDSEAAAKAQIVRLGNMLWHGADFDTVAKQHSHGFSASEGGKHDWITRGSLASREVENALFALPIGKLSRVIRDDRGLHIVKVLERVEDGTTPFTDAQGEIKQKIVKKRRTDAIDAYLGRLQDQADIWTIFDDAPARDISTGPSPSTPRR